MIDPVRLRLALWHTASLAILLIGFATATYAYFSRSSFERTDAEVRESLRAFLSDAQPEPGEDSHEDHIDEAASDFQSATRIIVFNAAGRVRTASRAAPNDPGPDASAVASIAIGGGSTGETAATIPDSAGGHRILVWHSRIGGDNVTLAGVRSLHERRQALRSMLLTFAVTIPVALLLAGLAGYRLAGHSLKPVVRMAEQQRRFMSDAAHELRTPVAILRAETDVALSQPRSVPEYVASLQLAHDESVRLSSIVEDLFLLARADAGQLPLRTSTVDLCALVADCARSIRPLADARAIEVTCETHGPADYPGDELLLRRMVLNLLDNAVKFSPSGSRVSVRVASAATTHTITVRDNGTPIDSTMRSRIFERFFRIAGKAESGNAGAGLGLAIARWIAQQHGGSLALNPAFQDGNEFVIVLPARGADYKAS